MEGQGGNAAAVRDNDMVKVLVMVIDSDNGGGAIMIMDMV